MCKHSLYFLMDCAKEKRLKNAQEVFQYLLIKGYHLHVWTYIVMINGLCKEGLFDEALALCQKWKMLVSFLVL